jgi:hypothetical protein
MPQPLLQFSATGTRPVIAIGVLALSAISLVLSVAIAMLLIRGYRHGPSHRRMLWLAVGLLLLTTVPELLRIGLPSLTAIGTVSQSIIVSGCELVGLGTVLWTVYGGDS